MIGAVCTPQKHEAEHVDEDSDVEEEVFLTKRKDRNPLMDELLLPEVQKAMRTSGPQLAETLKRGSACEEGCLATYTCRPCHLMTTLRGVFVRHRLGDARIHAEARCPPATRTR